MACSPAEINTCRVNTISFQLTTYQCLQLCLIIHFIIHLYPFQAERFLRGDL